MNPEQLWGNHHGPRRPTNWADEKLYPKKDLPLNRTTSDDKPGLRTRFSRKGFGFVKRRTRGVGACNYRSRSNKDPDSVYGVSVLGRSRCFSYGETPGTKP